MEILDEHESSACRSSTWSTFPGCLTTMSSCGSCSFLSCLHASTMWVREVELRRSRAERAIRRES